MEKRRLAVSLMCEAMKKTYKLCPDEKIHELSDDFISKYGDQPDGSVCLPPVSLSQEHYLEFEKYKKQTINLVDKVNSHLYINIS